MNRGWFPYLTVFLLLALLAVLATLQYRWLGQISDAESVRLSKRLTEDTNRFSSDFNREIQKAFISFQVNAEELEKADFKSLQKRYIFWKRESLAPDLIKNIYFVNETDKAELKQFDIEKGQMRIASWPGELSKARGRLNQELAATTLAGDSLLIPVTKEGSEMTRVVLTRKQGQPDEVEQERQFSLPANYGVLILQLDREVIKNSLLPALTKKYFSQDGAGSYELSVIDENGRPLYATHGHHFDTGDSSSGLLSLRVNDFAFFSKEMGNLVIDEKIQSRKRVLVAESFTKKSGPNKDENSVDVDVSAEPMMSHLTIFEDKTLHSDGAWRLYVRHRSGSLDQFIAETRMRNLGISFGILIILAAGMVLIVISSQRARAFANRQLDFVSSVSHEFRTPLAVIYSAGENISDGVVEDPEKIAEYGNLIKREGQKLSGMVEQILEHAGANSSNKNFEFSSVDVASLIEEVLSENLPLIKEAGFELERDIAPGLPPINADANSLQRAIQNLIANSLKYSNGERWICVSARNGGGEVSISVKDRGIGISKADQKHIFEPFYRSRSVVDEQIRGNGLGLSLVRQIIAAHGGTVSVASEIGKGTEFIITIPATGPMTA